MTKNFNISEILKSVDIIVSNNKDKDKAYNKNIDMSDNPTAEKIIVAAEQSLKNEDLENERDNKKQNHSNINITTTSSLNLLEPLLLEKEFIEEVENREDSSLTRNIIGEANNLRGLENNHINEIERLKSENIKPFCVKESPVNFECKVNQIISLGEEGGAGNLVICEILKIHINESILDSEKNIDPLKLNALSRLGGNWYGKSTKESLFQLTKPIGRIGMGVENLPKEIRTSSILSGSDLAILASKENIPVKKEGSLKEERNIKEKHIFAKKLLSQGKPEDAWQILL